MPVPTGPFVQLELVVRVAGAQLPPAGEVGLWLERVVVVGEVQAGTDFFARAPLMDAFVRTIATAGHPRLLQRMKPHRLPARYRIVRAQHVIRKHQHLPLSLMPEVVVDAFQLAQPRDKREIALAVLHAVLPHAVIAGQPLLHGVAVGFEHVGDDVRNGLALEDSEVAASRREPQPWAQLHSVEAMACVLSGQAEGRDDAAQVARAAALGLHCHGGGLAEQRFRVNVVAAAQQFHVEVVELAQRLAAGQPMELQRFPQRGLNGNPARHRTTADATAHGAGRTCRRVPSKMDMDPP